MSWALSNPDKIRFLQAYSQSPLLSPEARKEALFGTFGAVMELLKLAKQQGLFFEYRDELMMEMCHAMFMTSALYFIDNPHIANDEQQHWIAMAMSWNALATPGIQLLLPESEG